MARTQNKVTITATLNHNMVAERVVILPVEGDENEAREAITEALVAARNEVYSGLGFAAEDEDDDEEEE